MDTSGRYWFYLTEVYNWRVATIDPRIREPRWLGDPSFDQGLKGAPLHTANHPSMLIWYRRDLSQFPFFTGLTGPENRWVLWTCSNDSIKADSFDIRKCKAFQERRQNQEDSLWPEQGLRSWRHSLGMVWSKVLLRCCSIERNRSDRS